MVTSIFRNSQHSRWFDNGYHTMDIHTNQHNSLLPYFKTCRTNTRTLYHMGEHSIVFKLQCLHFKSIKQFKNCSNPFFLNFFLKYFRFNHINKIIFELLISTSHLLSKKIEKHQFFADQVIS